MSSTTVFSQDFSSLYSAQEFEQATALGFDLPAVEQVQADSETNSIGIAEFIEMYPKDRFVWRIAEKSQVPSSIIVNRKGKIDENGWCELTGDFDLATKGGLIYEYRDNLKLLVHFNSDDSGKVVGFSLYLLGAIDCPWRFSIHNETCMRIFQGTVDGLEIQPDCTDILEGECYWKNSSVQVEYGVFDNGFRSDSILSDKEKLEIKDGQVSRANSSIYPALRFQFRDETIGFLSFDMYWTIRLAQGTNRVY
jgi:hypothetical protein